MKNENDIKEIRSGINRYIEVEALIRTENMGTGVMTPCSTSYSNDF
jgi:hypothetical protein